MHITRLHEWDDEYLIAFTEEDAARLGLVEGASIHFNLKKIEDPEATLSEDERAKIDRDYVSFKKQLEELVE